MRWLIALLFISLLLSSAFAQTPAQPYGWPQTVGTSPAQVLPANPLRKQIVFHNPNATATVAVCPAVSRKDSTNITCAVNGAGSITLFPGQTVTIAGLGSGPVSALPSAWNGVASSGGSALTIFEFE